MEDNSPSEFVDATVVEPNRDIFGWEDSSNVAVTENDTRIFVGKEGRDDYPIDVDLLESLQPGDDILVKWREPKKGERLPPATEVKLPMPDDSSDDQTTEGEGSDSTDGQATLGDDTTMTDDTYDFVTADAQDDDQTTTTTDAGTNKWSLGSHSGNTGLSADDLDDAIGSVRDVNDDLADVLEEARDMVSGTDIRGFECPVCGLKHGHSDDKHDIRSGFGVRNEFAEQMDFTPYCHCGVNELAMIVDFLPYITDKVFEDDFMQLREEAGERLTDALRAMREDDAIPAHALSEAGLTPTYDGMASDLRQLTRKIDRIKNSAESAPIAEETRKAIGNRRDVLEQIGE